MDENFKVKLEESCLPLLGSGEYVLTAQIEGKELGNSDCIEDHFYIDGPRFQLAKDDIVSVYPGNGMKGSFGDSFAHVILGRRTLPWERSIETEKCGRSLAEQENAPTGEPPWLCVLLLHDEEIPAISSGTVENVIKPADSIYFPGLSLESGEEKEECSYIDLPCDLFLQIVPSVQELALLSHARQVEPDGKAANATPAEEWVSAVVGNRLPASGTEGIRNRAYLVSLEGYGDYAATLSQKDYEKVRLIVLHSWEFYSVTEPWHFLELCAELDTARLCATSENGTDRYRQILENGYFPMRHRLREGSQTVSFYRGPLVSGCVKEEQKEKDAAIWSQDALYRYDPEIGMFDISYAAAWQLGRLLAFGNQAVAKQIQKIRTETKRRLQKQEEEKMLQEAGVRLQEEGQEERRERSSAVEWLVRLLEREGGTLL
jgi:hypothetical protein